MGSIGKSNILNTIGLPAKTKIKNKDIYKGYAWQLASVVDNDEVYQLKYNGGQAFADARVDDYGDIHIDYIGSTGKGAGSELMARLADKAIDEGRGMSWVADEPSAQQFYSHLGLKPKSKYEGVWYYELQWGQLYKLRAKLRKTY